MDKKQARKELQTLRDSITKVLGEKSNEDISEHIQEAQESASEGAKALKKSLIERIKDLPVVTQVSQLGAAGTVAVSTAAVTQVDIAKDRTEIFVAEVAQDVVEQRFEVPQFIDNFVDFASLNDWGQEVIAEKIQEAQAFVAEASEPQQTSTPSAESSDTTPETSSSSQDSSSDNASQPSNTDKSPESEKTQKQETKEESSSNDQEKDKKDKQQSEVEQTTEDKKESQEKESSSEPTKEPKEVKPSNAKMAEQAEAKSDSIPIVETPIDSFDDDIKPHSQVRQVSPTQ